MVKLSDYVVDFVARQGVRHVFLLPGGGCMHLVDSLGRDARLEAVCCLHEQAAAIAAEAYAQFTGGFGAALVTTGPGGTNAITGVAGAWIESTPLLVVSGQVKTSDLASRGGVRQMGVQEVDVVSLVRPVTKYAVTVTDPSSIRYHLEKAVHLARAGRSGPVWIDIPLDVQGAMVEPSRLKGYAAPAARPRAGLRGKSDRLLGLLKRARRPVLLAGNGVRLAGAVPEFRALVDRLRIPVLLTWKTVDLLPEGHPLLFGRPGSIAQRHANFIQQNADLILVLGSRLDLTQVGFDYRGFAPAARKVLVDVDPAELRKVASRTSVAMAVQADAGELLRELLGRRPEPCRVEEWLSRCRAWKAKYPVVTPAHRKPGRFVNTYALVEALSEAMGSRDVLVPGSSGGCSEITLQSFPVRKGQRVVNNPGLGAMGFGVPAAVGACLASGRRRTVGIVGDGGLQLNIQELETISRLKLPIKLFVLNNRGFASIRSMQRAHFQGRLVCCEPGSGLSFPDLRKVAAAYGLAYRRITGRSPLSREARAALRTPGPALVEVMADPDLITAPRLSSTVLPGGRIVSKPMEDLWPFLDREELRADMEPSRGEGD